MIEQQLAERFQAALADEPPPGFDPDQLIDQLGRRRRRLAVAGAAAVTVVSAAAAVAGVTMIGGAADSFQPAASQEPTRTSQTPMPSPPPSRPSITFGISAEAPVTTDPTLFEQFPETTGRDHGLVVTDLAISNANGDVGTLRILRGGEVLLELPLGNFRDFDYRFQDSIDFGPAQPVIVAVSCQQAGDGDGTCDESVIVAGAVVGR